MTTSSFFRVDILLPMRVAFRVLETSSTALCAISADSNSSSSSSMILLSFSLPEMTRPPVGEAESPKSISTFAGPEGTNFRPVVLSILSLGVRSLFSGTLAAFSTELALFAFLRSLRSNGLANGSSAGSSSKSSHCSPVSAGVSTI